MRTIVALGFGLALLAGSVSSQVYFDGFNYPDGTTVPNWNETVGDWSVQSKQLVGQPTSLWQYIVLDPFSELNACVQMNVFYNTASPRKLQFGGGTLRYSTASNVMCKIQDNNSSGDFDRFFVYDQPGGSAYVDPVPPTTICGVRFYTIDNDVIGQIDTDMDGKWDYTVTKPTTQTAVAGKVGIAGFNDVIIDDFMYFNAIARVDPASQPPTPGSLVTFQLKGPANKLYQAACSFGNTGFALDTTRRIPLNVDNLFILSVTNPVLFQNFADRLDANGDGKAGVQLPKIPQLQGLPFYFGFVALDAAAPSFIGNISNDERVDIQ